MLKRFFSKANPVEKLREVVGDYELPSFSVSTMEVLRMLRDKSTPPKEIAKVVLGDPGMSVRILKTVNSAAYAPRRPIANVDQAVVMLGNASLEQIVMALAIRTGLPTPRCDGFDPGRFWVTSARRAAVARELADRLHPATACESFSAALLEDMAVPLLAHCRTAQYAPILREAQNSPEPLHNLEREVFGWDHAAVATWMAAGWGLPERLADAVGDHHTRKNEMPAVYLVGLMVEGNDDQESLIEEARTEFGVPSDVMQEMLVTGEERAKDLARLLA